VKNAVVGIDVENANARKQTFADLDWVIDWITHHIDDYDTTTVRKLAPVADQLVKLASKPPVGLTDEERERLNELVGLLTRVAALEAAKDDHEKRIAALERPYALGLNLGAYDLNANWVVGAEGCPLDLTFGRGAFSLRGCVGGGVTTDTGEGVLIVEGLFNLRVVQPVYLTLGYLYAQQPGTSQLKGADWIVSAGTLGGFVRPVSWFEIGGAAGVGQCDSRTTTGKETCFTGSFKASFRVEL
jgi:hypothetical protein